MKAFIITIMVCQILGLIITIWDLNTKTYPYKRSDMTAAKEFAGALRMVIFISWAFAVLSATL